MAIIATNLTGAGNLVSIAAGESLFVPQSVLLASTTGNAVVVSGNSAVATIAGSLYGDISGFGNSASYTEVTLHVLATGSVASGFSGGARGGNLLRRFGTSAQRRDDFRQLRRRHRGTVGR